MAHEAPSLPASNACPPGRCMLCGETCRPTYDFGSRVLAYCAACELGQLAPLPSEEELAALYTSRDYFADPHDTTAGYADYLGDAPQFARTFRGKLRLLLRGGPVADLAEIGCGPGYFLREAGQAGIPHLVGVDRNAWAVGEARRAGLEAYVGSSEALPRGSLFDAIAMLDLLEHIRDPRAFLEDLRRRLKPGGRLLIMTPNIRSWLARISGRRWVSLKIPEHVYYYSPRSIRRLLESARFDVLSVRPAGQYVTIRFLLSRLARLAPRGTRMIAAAARRLRLEERVIYVTNGSIDVVARVRREGT